MCALQTLLQCMHVALCTCRRLQAERKAHSSRPWEFIASGAPDNVLATIGRPHRPSRGCRDCSGWAPLDQPRSGSLF
jgi:hypothetical protein